MDKGSRNFHCYSKLQKEECRTSSAMTFSNSSLGQPWRTWTFILVLSCKRGFTTCKHFKNQTFRDLFIPVKENNEALKIGTNLPTCRKYTRRVNNVVSICLLWVVQVIDCGYSSQKLHGKSKKENKTWTWKVFLMRFSEETKKKLSNKIPLFG